MANNLTALINIGGAISGTLMASIGSATSRIGRLGSSVRNLQREQIQLGRQIAQMSAAGQNVDELRRRYERLTAELERQRRSLDHLRRIHGQMEAGRARMANAAMTIGAIAASAGAALLPVVQAASFEKAMLGVAKQVQGARDESGKLTGVYFDMAKQIQMLGREIPLTTNSLAEMVAAGARMGVAKEDLIQFTKTSAMMAAAFELPASELAEQMGKIANLYKIPIPAIGSLADTINFLDDNAISKGADIIDFLTRVGGVAGSVKVTGQQMAALGSTLLTLGERSETASTATNALFQKLAAADKGTKKFKEAVKEIGLSTAAIQKGMQTDAQGTILNVLDAINKMPAEKRLGVMVELVGLEHSDTLAKLVSNIEEYRKQIALAGNDKAKGSMSKEFAALLDTTNAKWEITKNLATELGVNIGSVLLPAVNSVMGAIVPVVTATADWVRENKTLVGDIAAAVGTVGGLVVGLKLLSFGAGAVKFAFGALRLALVAHPFIALGIAVVTAAVMIYKNWEPIKEFFIDLWGTITTKAGEAWSWFKENMSWHPLALIANNWEPIRDFFTNLWADITKSARDAFDWVLGKIDAIGQGWQRAKAFFGYGDGQQATAPASLPLPPAVPALAASRASAGQASNTQNTFHITQQPGENGEHLAQRVIREMDKRNGVRARSAMYDMVSP